MECHRMESWGGGMECLRWGIEWSLEVEAWSVLGWGIEWSFG